MRGVAVMLLWLAWALPGAAAAGETLRVIDDFEQGLRPQWQEKSFAGHTDYQVVRDDGGHCLRAQAEASASGLIYKIEYDPRRFPILSWRWKIAATLPKGDARQRAGDDYAARVYVIFPHWFFPLTRSLNYIWANRLPQGDFLPNPFTGQAMMVAVESGAAQKGEWLSERRNVVEDFRRAFQAEPPLVGAIAVMTDADNTGGSATGWYDDICISPE